jgi:hypothetical protein
MRKVSRFCFIAFLFAFGCKNGADAKQQEDDTVVVKNSKVKEIEEKVEKLVGMDYVGNDTAFTYEILNGWLKLELSGQKVIEVLGKPSEKGTDDYWGAIGTYVQEWNYNKLGLKLQMESDEEGGPKKVLSIKIVAPNTMKTSQGVGIGSAKEEVSKIYAAKIDAEFTNDNQIVVESIYGGVIFTIKDNKVSELFIGAAAE